MSPRRCRVWAATPGWDDALELCDVDGDDVGVEGDGVAGGDEGGRAVGVEGLADGEDGLAQGGATAVGGQVIPEQGDELFAGMGAAREHGEEGEEGAVLVGGQGQARPGSELHLEGTEEGYVAARHAPPPAATVARDGAAWPRARRLVWALLGWERRPDISQTIPRRIPNALGTILAAGMTRTHEPLWASSPAPQGAEEGSSNGTPQWGARGGSRDDRTPAPRRQESRHPSARISVRVCLPTCLTKSQAGFGRDHPVVWAGGGAHAIASPSTCTRCLVVAPIILLRLPPVTRIPRARDGRQAIGAPRQVVRVSGRDLARIFGTRIPAEVVLEIACGREHTTCAVRKGASVSDRRVHSHRERGPPRPADLGPWHL
jgi:hypothetical protein